VGALHYAATTGLSGPQRLTVSQRHEATLMGRQMAKRNAMYRSKAEAERRAEFQHMLTLVEHRQRCMEQMDIAAWRRRYLERAARQDEAYGRVLEESMRTGAVPRAISPPGRFLKTTSDALRLAQLSMSN
jgi:hypothetical protein